MHYDFDKFIERRNTGSGKWDTYDDDVIPMWVADMDFAVAKEIKVALTQRVNHAVFGYSAKTLPNLLNTICERTQTLYNWHIKPEEIMFFPGLGSALNVFCNAFGKPGDEVLIQPPIYFPFMDAITNQNKVVKHAPLIRHDNEQFITYKIDFERLEKTITDKTRMILLSNPHNPVGKMYNKEDLSQLIHIVQKHDLIICSDEIHCELILSNYKHFPTASISNDIADRCVTLMAPSKTFNLAGLSCGYAVIQNADLLLQMKSASKGIVPGVNVLGYTAALAAYQHGNHWLNEVLSYLKDNRDYVIQFLNKYIPNVRTTCPNATYLMWLDCNQLNLPSNPQTFFLKEAKLAFSDGSMFGPGGKGFIRMNLACSRTLLESALTRMKNALQDK